MKTAQEWINSTREYNMGVELYSEIGGNANMKRVFKNQPESEFLRGKLLYEMQEILKKEAVQQAPEPTQTKDFETQTKQKKQPINIDLLPEEYKKLNLRKASLFKEASYLHARLDLCVTNQERLASAIKIIKNFDDMDAIWAKFDYFQEHGTVMPIDKTIEINIDTATPSELLSYRNNLRSHISKLKNKPKRINDLLAKQKELERVMIKLKAS